MIGFILGLFVGAPIGIFTACLLMIGKRSDERAAYIRGRTHDAITTRISLN